MSEIKGNISLVNGKTIKVRPIDASKLLLDISSVAFLDVRKDDDNHIQTVSFEDKFILSLNDTFSVKIGNIQSIYTNKYMIIDGDKKTIIVFSSVPNKTSIFLLPLLGKSKTSLEFDTYFINAYLSPTKTHLHLLYRFTGTDYYKKFEENMMKDALCVTHTEHDPYKVVYIFKIPEEFKQDIEHFINGKYSKFSKTLRQRIARFYGSGGENTAIMQIINKSDELKINLEEYLKMSLPDDAELASKPDIKNELYNIEL